MSAIAAGEGPTVALVESELTRPPTITTMSSTSAAAPISAARAPCRAPGTRTAAEPIAMTIHCISLLAVIQRILCIAPAPINPARHRVPRGDRSLSSRRILAEQVPIEHPRFLLRFEPEPLIQLRPELLVSLDDRVA